MNYLDQIVAQKRTEVAQKKHLNGVKTLQTSPLFNHTARSLSAYLTRKGHNGIVAEFKRQSPSKGVIHATANVAETAVGYQQAGVSALSVLTDEPFFGGTNQDLVQAFGVVQIPILRKEFIIDPWQIYEARSIGASAILLIAAILTPREATEMAALASYLGLETLMEFHADTELDRLNPYVHIAGINNRNLKNFEVDLNHSVALASKLPASLPRISESGIHSADDLWFLHQNGFDGFLMGEYFMKHANPADACKTFCAQLPARQIRARI